MGNVTPSTPNQAILEAMRTPAAVATPEKGTVKTKKVLNPQPSTLNPQPSTLNPEP